jgi:hypothetical protein
MIWGCGRGRPHGLMRTTRLPSEPVAQPGAPATHIALGNSPGEEPELIGRRRRLPCPAGKAAPAAGKAAYQFPLRVTAMASPTTPMGEVGPPMDRPPPRRALHVTQGVIEAWGDVRRQRHIGGIGRVQAHHSGPNSRRFETNRRIKMSHGTQNSPLTCLKNISGASAHHRELGARIPSDPPFLAQPASPTTCRPHIVSVSS